MKEKEKRRKQTQSSSSSFSVVIHLGKKRFSNVINKKKREIKREREKKAFTSFCL
jgi:hypothetical protein